VTAENSRAYPVRPIVSVGAVIVLDDSILLVKRAHPPLQGQWSLPGGVVEIGETRDEALAREVLEETGLEIEIGPIVEVLDRVQRAPDGRVEYHYVILDYLCRPRAGVLAHGSDADDVRWVRVTDLHDYAVTEKVGAVVQKALELARQAT